MSKPKKQDLRKKALLEDLAEKKTLHRRALLAQERLQGEQLETELRDIARRIRDINDRMVSAMRNGIILDPKLVKQSVKGSV